MIRAALDSLWLAVRALWQNALRSLLTLLGIVIGVATVIAMMGLIEGLRLKMNSEFSFLGANTFQVSKMPNWVHSHAAWEKFRKRPDLTVGDMKAFQSAPSVAQVSAGSMTSGQRVTSRWASTDPDVMVGGDTPEVQATSGVSLSAGRFFTRMDILNGQRVAVIGQDVANKLFPGGNPLGGEIRLEGRPFRVVGIQAQRGTLLGRVNLDEIVYVPLHSFLELYGRRRRLTIEVLPKSPKQLQKAEDEVTAILRGRHRLKPLAPDDFEIGTNDSMMSTFNGIAKSVSAAGFAICLLSLVVGGIGILNIMLVSVSERTQEIGIRKALGAKRKRILAQFTVEAILLSLLGGLIGVGLGYGVSFLAHWVADFDVAVPIWSVALALGVASTVGLGFGIYPAAKASKLDPVEAMRAE